MAVAAWDRYAELASGVVSVSRKTAEAAVSRLVQQGELAADRAERAVDELLARSERNRKALGELISGEVARVADRLELVRREELDELAARLDALEAELSALRDDEGDTS